MGTKKPTHALCKKESKSFGACTVVYPAGRKAAAIDVRDVNG